jgi:hypothetical protein
MEIWYDIIYVEQLLGYFGATGAGAPRSTSRASHERVRSRS